VGPEPHRVLVLGPSQVSYAYHESQETTTVGALLERALVERAPATQWRCESRALFYGPRMAERAAALVRELQPDAVFLTLSANPFLRDIPMARIRRRWPRLYPAARRIAERLKRLAGGGQVSSPKGWVFRFPQWLLLIVVGGEPEVAVDAARAFTLETLQALTRQEDLPVVCRLPGAITAVKSSREKEKYRERMNSFLGPVRDYCGQHGVFCWDLWAELSRAGRDVGISPDGEYTDLPTRRFEADSVAEMLTSLLEISV
jgi:hypothetical protein